MTDIPPLPTDHLEYVGLNITARDIADDLIGAYWSTSNQAHLWQGAHRNLERLATAMGYTITRKEPT